jgi:NAD(P)-dependent dehydrogenase (short-subunit alcohol dehydrogenase family)
MEIKKFILVTGASSGIGKIIATKLSENYNLIIHGRDMQRLEETKQYSSKKNDVLIWQYDLNNISAIEDDLADFISNHYITIAGFVHSAGYLKILPLKLTTIDYINVAFNTNVISASLIVKTLISKKINISALNNVVFISSNISNMGAKAMSIYGSTKGALDSLMRCLAIELAPKVRVNSVLPGGVKTEMTASIYENKELIDRMEATYPLGFGYPEDIYEAVNFLLSDKSRWITGQQFTVDGGRTINITG